MAILMGLIMNVLFVCRANNGRSQIAEAIFNRLSRNRATSAGLEVGIEGSEGSVINKLDISVMNEIGYDLSGYFRKQLTRELTDNADVIVSMVDVKHISNYLNKSKRVIYWDIAASRNSSHKSEVITRDKIKKKVVQLVKELR